MTKPSKPEPRFFTIQVHKEVVTLLEQVETLFQQKTNVRPSHSPILVNALQTYKQKLLISA